MLHLNAKPKQILNIFKQKQKFLVKHKQLHVNNREALQKKKN